MSTSIASTSAVLLRKRKRQGSPPLVLHLSSPSPSYDPQSESEYEPDPTFDIPVASSSTTPAKSIDTLIAKKRYPCTFDGCTKAYTKPSRLQEHERSHTGDRPFKCSTCSKSYLRESHLQAHARSHLPSSSKPFACDELGCEKRFWTSQHLRVHSELHNGEKPFKCISASCEAEFAKHHQLRDHICSVHSPPGTKSYRCEHPRCTKSFVTNQKLRVHAKTHDNKRYTCVHTSCSIHGSAPVYYPTWTALQLHMKTAHPPTCPYPSCNGKIFTAQKGLRAHLKIHEQRDVEAELRGGGSENEEEDGDEDEKPRKRRRGGEVGRDWVCEVQGCGKDFKSKKALTTHTNVSHLGRRDFVCPHTDCKRAFGYKHLLQRHVAKVHPSESEIEQPTSGSGSDESDGELQNTGDQSSMTFNIDDITGVSYTVKSKAQIQNVKTLRCPHPDLSALLGENADRSNEATVPGSSGDCEYVYTRAYDLRRHLKAEHGIEVEKEKLDEWVRLKKKAKASAL